MAPFYRTTPTATQPRQTMMLVSKPLASSAGADPPPPPPQRRHHQPQPRRRRRQHQAPPRERGRRARRQEGQAPLAPAALQDGRAHDRRPQRPLRCAPSRSRPRHHQGRHAGRHVATANAPHPFFIKAQRGFNGGGTVAEGKMDEALLQHNFFMLHEKPIMSCTNSVRALGMWFGRARRERAAFQWARSGRINRRRICLMFPRFGFFSIIHSNTRRRSPSWASSSPCAPS